MKLEAVEQEAEEEAGMRGMEGCRLDLVFCKAAAKAAQT